MRSPWGLREGGRRTGAPLRAAPRRGTQAQEPAATPGPGEAKKPQRGLAGLPGPPGKRGSAPQRPPPAPARPHGDPEPPARPPQSLPTWRRPWPPGAGPGGRREEGAGPSSGLSGAAPGLGPAGDRRLSAAAGGSGRGLAPPRGGGGGAGGSGARPSERGLKALAAHRRGEAQRLVLYEQPSCIYSLPP